MMTQVRYACSRSQDHSSRSSMKNSLQTTSSTRSLIGLQLKSATAVCLISGRKSTHTKSQSYIPRMIYREPVNCPLNGNCLQSSVIYQATVETNDNKPSQTYIGLTENSFKTRFTNHRNSFKDHKKKLSTELSKHVWKLKEANVDFQISWKILKHAASFNPVKTLFS